MGWFKKLFGMTEKNETTQQGEKLTVPTPESSGAIGDNKPGETPELTTDLPPTPAPKEFEWEECKNGKITKPYEVPTDEDPWKVSVHYNSHNKAIEYPYLNKLSAQTAYERMKASLNE